MAFTCEPCHKKPIRTLCFVGFTSFGRCENCGQQAECTDCKCPTLNAGLHTPSEPVKHRLDRAALRGGKTAEMEKLTRAALDGGETVRIEAPNYVSCRLCGKSGSHTHTPAGRKTSDELEAFDSDDAPGPDSSVGRAFIADQRRQLAARDSMPDNAAYLHHMQHHSYRGNIADCPTCRMEAVENDEPRCNDCDGYVYAGETCRSCGLVGTIPRDDTLDTVIREVVESRRKALKHMTADDVRAFFEGNLTVALGPDGMCLNRIDQRTDALVDHLHPDSEHEPGNPNCLCFQRSCR